MEQKDPFVVCNVDSMVRFIMAGCCAMLRV